MSRALRDAWAIIAGHPLDTATALNEPMPRPTAAVTAICTEDQARAGGCCICTPLGCAGLDTARPCHPSCRWCATGCPSDGACVCVTLRIP